ncbi:MAG: hypothetical protein R3344_06775, partial [Acidobacteriota bacterium]|nr:hypothetical protein [Acidobacteriota bacterium]
MKRRTALRIAWVGCVVLTLFHLDFWRPQRVALLGGWLPEELAYRIAFVVLAWGFMLFVCAYV